MVPRVPRARTVVLAAGLALLLGGALATGGADDGASAGAPPVLVGEGEHVYAWVGDWARLPEGDEIGFTHGGVALDAAGRVYVETETERGILVFAPDGTLAGSVGADIARGLHGIAVHAEEGGEFLYATQIRLGKVYKLTLSGELVWELGWPEESGLYDDASQYHPTAVAVASSGDVYVADGYGRSFVHVYDRERRYKGSFGGVGNKPHRMRSPHGLWIGERDGREVVLVADRENGRAQVFGLRGELLELWTDGLVKPCSVRPRGDLVAAADLDGAVALLDGEGRLLVRLGANPDPALRRRNDVPPADLLAGRFAAPHGLCWAPDGSLFVVEWLKAGRITKLVPHR